MDNIIQLFIDSGAVAQILSILIIGAGIVYLFGVVFESHRLSLNLLIDPGSFANVEDKKKIIFGIFEVIVGIVLISSIASVITNQMLELSDSYKLKTVHSVLKEAFENHSSSQTRLLLEEEKISARLRLINLTEAETRLEFSRDDIVKAIRKYGQLRLRTLKTTNQIIIEDFESNKNYGSFIDRNSPITIVSTQNYSDAGIGHYASTLAKNLDANYISNEFYSSGALLKLKQINFSSNDSFLNMKEEKLPALQDFINDLKSLNEKTKLFVYIGTSSAKMNYDIHLLFGGDLNSSFDVKTPTYSNLKDLQTFYSDLKSNLQSINLKLATHEEFANIKKNHLSNGIHSNFSKDVITIYISTKMLWSDDDLEYYKSINYISSALKNLQ